MNYICTHIHHAESILENIQHRIQNSCGVLVTVTFVCDSRGRSPHSHFSGPFSKSGDSRIVLGHRLARSSSEGFEPERETVQVRDCVVRYLSWWLPGSPWAECEFKPRGPSTHICQAADLAQVRTWLTLEAEGWPGCLECFKLKLKLQFTHN